MKNCKVFPYHFLLFPTKVGEDLVGGRRAGSLVYPNSLVTNPEKRIFKYLIQENNEEEGFFESRRLLFFLKTDLVFRAGFFSENP